MFLESVLNGYKKQVVLEDIEDFNIHDQQRIIDKLGFLKDAEAHLRDATEDQFVQRSKKIYDSFRLKTNWTPNSNEKLSEEYLNYDKFAKNQAKLKTKELDIEDSGDYCLGKNMKKLMKNLDKNMADNLVLDNIKEELEEEQDYDGQADEDMELIMEAQDRDLRDLIDTGFITSEINLGDVEKREHRDEYVFGRISIHAREQIYHMYLQGSTVRDLSIKFGILPERVKAIVWMRQLYYEEVMPRIDLMTIKLGLEMEMLYNMDFPFIDYGSDLVLMAQRERGVLFQRYRRSDVDINPPKEVKDRMEKILEKQKKPKKHDIVTEKFVGTGSRGYFVKSWVVYSGHGSERVNKKFKDIVHNSTKKHRLPYTILKNLDKGPRLASKGFGIK